ncbi:uncharacterized protein LACBIDRAFT_317450 [Laccaria bicolor S238N-H82]|uniref:Predicted protein n=1 Tax=Laccaria bicolor (strain S238N-H82 / ATCC MYA-4686) TaxID=486041 RepID=B0E1T3_LACBS|nr:uncharacterized protein LACBIDRAFT_317450 [Laccaria bicolor S238N-H82]EDQ99179.1 predicted protein [Laccaria bicolor S238N-H82]|eukprot:XP_001890146.1 predicted protein [Laccaria bicolor S238N-H82]
MCANAKIFMVQARQHIFRAGVMMPYLVIQGNAVSYVTVDHNSTACCGFSLLYKMVRTTPHSPPKSSPDMSDLGCAVVMNGNLLNASEIIFYNDPDNETPISGSGASPPKPSVHPFFSHNTPPTRIVVGACCSSHTSHPSARLVDPDNAKSSAEKSVSRGSEESVI